VPWSGAPNCLVCHRTVSGAPGPYKVQLSTLGFLRVCSAIIHRTVRCATGLSGAPVEQRLFGATVDCKRRGSDEQCVQKSEHSSEAHRTVNSVCPVPLEDKASNGQKPPDPNGWVMWLAHQTVSGGAPDCPVCPSTTSIPNGYVVVEGYKYPQPPPLQASKFPALHIQYKS
jgi:hypothetical protein